MRWILAFLLSVAPAYAAKKKSAPQTEQTEVDPLSLAARLMGDGYWDRAGRVLDEADVASVDDRARYYTLLGLVRDREGRTEEARDAFLAAMGEEGVDPLIALHLAQSWLRLNEAAEALAVLDGADPAVHSNQGYWLLKARAAWAVPDHQAAWVALVQGESQFPESPQFMKQRLLLLVDMGLYQEVVAQGSQWLQGRPDDVEGWLMLSEALRQSGALDDAHQMLEEAHLRFPHHGDVYAALGRVLLQLDQPYVAGEVLLAGAELDPGLFGAAAEGFRRAGDLDRALYASERIVDPGERARQRLGLYVERGDWGRAAALEGRLDRLGLLDDDAVRYAVAFSWFQLGDRERAEQQLKGIVDPKWFKDAVTLREAMSRCDEEGALCP